MHLAGPVCGFTTEILVASTTPAVTEKNYSNEFRWNHKQEEDFETARPFRISRGCMLKRG